MRMHVEQTKKIAGVAMLSALSVILLVAGSFVKGNTLFLTALAAYLVGYAIFRYGLSGGVMQCVLCTLLDAFFNPDKVNFLLYLGFSIYILLSEIIFQKCNKMKDLKKKMRRQLIYNWILFNIIYIPVVVLFENILIQETRLSGSVHKWILVIVGQIGWWIYDKAYREFFRFLRERKLLKK
ncbi:MAG: hypothetical protein ACI4SQ_06160 [Eubacterium sp.]